jgi:hypothetical protein
MKKKEIIYKKDMEKNPVEKPWKKLMLIFAFIFYLIFTGLLFFIISLVIHPPPHSGLDDFFDIIFPKLKPYRPISVKILPPAPQNPIPPPNGTYLAINPALLNESNLIANISDVKLEEIKKSKDFWIIKLFDFIFYILYMISYRNDPKDKKFGVEFLILAESFKNYTNIHFGQVNCSNDQGNFILLYGLIILIKIFVLN